MAREKICGIYCIENLENWKKYIGLSRDIYRRFANHKLHLKTNNHRNNYLQNSWNIHGKNFFKFYILEECDEKFLSDLEKYYIQKYKTNVRKFGYNLTDGGESRFIINKDINELKSEKYSKRVVQFDLDGTPLCEHLNCIKASILYGGDKSGSGVYQVCLGYIETIYGYKWKYKENCSEEEIENIKDKPSIIKFPKGNFRRIYKFNKKGKLLKIYENLTEAQKDVSNKCSKGLIGSCCDRRYGRRTIYGFILMYEYDYLKNGINLSDYKKHKCNKPVVKIDKNTGEVLEIYESAREASKYGYDYKKISAVCLGDRKTHKNYIWMFKDNYSKNMINLNNYKNCDNWKPKPVARCDKNTGEILEVYESAKDASKQGYTCSVISIVCNGKGKTHKGYVWKFI